MSIDLKHYSLIIGMKNMGAMYKRSEYPELVYTTQVNSAFHAL